MSKPATDPSERLKYHLSTITVWWQSKVDKWVLEVESWHTPASDYPIKSVGNAKIERAIQRKGYYRMEGVNGYAFYRVVKPIEITLLKINKRTVMTDEPINWYGMRSLAKYSGSRILVGGLGLGLIVHALATRGKHVEEIKIIEINGDVIELITPLLPKNLNISIEQGDVMRYADGGSYDTVILDIWAGRCTTRVLSEMNSAYRRFKRLYPEARVYIWGHGNTDINPAVDPYVRMLLPSTYWET